MLAMLVAGSRCSTLTVDCGLTESNHDAIRTQIAANSNTTERLWLRDCDLRRFNFSLLSRSPYLNSLYVVGGRLTEFHGLTFLLKVERISINTTGFRRWYRPFLTPKLNSVTLRNIADDDTADGIVEGLLPYGETLKTLHLEQSALTRVPPRVQLLAALRFFYFVRMPLVTTLPFGTFLPSFNADLYIRDCNITSIEPGAFQGYYGGRNIDLRGPGNEYVGLDERVFGQMLRQMHFEGRGSLDLNYVGPCGCGLSWLNRDSPYLLEYVDGAECFLPAIGWTVISQLDRQLFRNCPINLPLSPGGFLANNRLAMTARPALRRTSSNQNRTRPQPTRRNSLTQVKPEGAGR